MNRFMEILNTSTGAGMTMNQKVEIRSGFNVLKYHETDLYDTYLNGFCFEFQTMHNTLTHCSPPY